MAKMHSNIGQLLVSIRKQIKNYALRQHFTNSAINKDMDKIYQVIEQDHPQFNNILGVLPYFKMSQGHFVHNGILVSRGTLAMFEFKRKFRLFGKVKLEYTYEEYDMDSISFPARNHQDQYGNEISTVSVVYKENNIATFQISSIAYELFVEAFEQSKAAFL